MPRRLPDRCLPDCVREFRAAARRRFDDALALAGRGRRTGAIYLWGYTAEMTLKAAYFALIGLADTDLITWTVHLQPAIQRGKSLGVVWPSQGAGHNVRAWAELLAAERSLSPATAWPAPFGREVERRAQQISRLWRETLRYHKNDAYLYEVKQVREASEWLIVHSDAL